MDPTGSHTERSPDDGGSPILTARTDAFAGSSLRELSLLFETDVVIEEDSGTQKYAVEAIPHSHFRRANRGLYLQHVVGRCSENFDGYGGRTVVGKGC